MGPADLDMAGRLCLASFVGPGSGRRSRPAVVCLDPSLQVSIIASCPENADVDKLSGAFSTLSEVEKVEID